MSHPLLEHARAVVRFYLEGVDWRGRYDGEFTRPSQGCFVSIKVRKRLRGCIGTLFPVRDTLEEEVADNAVAAATRDTRFKPLTPSELPDTSFSIDLLSHPEPVLSKEDLDPFRFGVIVRADNRCGVLLPDIPGVESVEKQLEICREKAGIESDGEISLSRFRVERLQEAPTPGSMAGWR